MIIPNIKSVVAIGDIHGCLQTFLALINKVKTKWPDSEIVLCGDLVDRGPNSCDVVQYVKHNKILCVKGNHEVMMYTDVLGLPSNYSGLWSQNPQNGGQQTIESYQGNLDLMKEHAEWMQTLPLYIEFPDAKMVCDDQDWNGERHLVVSHSNVGAMWKHKDNPKWAKQFEEYVLWERFGQENNKDIFNCIGHTPFPDGPKIRSFYANLDTGAVYNRIHYGKLTAMHYPSLEYIQQDNIDK